MTKLTVGLLLLLLNAVSATTISGIFGNSQNPWGTYGGDVQYGSMEWNVQNGSAIIKIELDEAFSIFGFSMNTNVNSEDFFFVVGGSGDWRVRGLNTVEAIGTDLFDYSVWTGISGYSNSFELEITGINLSSDNDLFRENILPRNLEDWDRLLHRSHFGVYARNEAGQIYTLSDVTYQTNSGNTSTIPEPGTLALMILGSALLYFKNRKSTI